MRLDKDPSWIVEYLRNKTLTCVTDGSYMKDKAPNICSAGWVMACKQTKHHIFGTLVERLESVDVISDSNKVCCDNKGALYTFAKKSK